MCASSHVRRGLDGRVGRHPPVPHQRVRAALGARRRVEQPTGGLANRRDPDRRTLRDHAPLRRARRRRHPDLGRARDAAAWARDVSCAGDTALTLRHTTIVGAGDPESTGVLAQAVGAGNKATVRVANSIVDGVGHALSRHAVTGARASLVADWSSWAPDGVVSENLTGGTGALTTLERVPGAPVFADPTPATSGSRPAHRWSTPASLSRCNRTSPAATWPAGHGSPRASRVVCPGATWARSSVRRQRRRPPRRPRLRRRSRHSRMPAPAAAPLAQGELPGLALSLSAARRQRVLRDGVVLIARSQTAVTLHATASLRIAGRRGSVQCVPPRRRRSPLGPAASSCACRHGTGPASSARSRRANASPWRSA